jgi:hypothetical protein
VSTDDPARVLEELRQLTFRLHLEEAERLCAECLAKYPEFRDNYGHPAFLKEAFRLALLRRRMDDAERLAGELRARLPAHDPSMSVLLARHHAQMGDRAAARAEWHNVLKLSPNHAEALLGLKAAAINSVIVNGITMVPL